MLSPRNAPCRTSSQSNEPLPCCAPWRAARRASLLGDGSYAFAAITFAVGSVATLGLGFFWIGFDSEKRGLHDWLAGTYVVKA